jgi:hypothetical protein
MTTKNPTDPLTRDALTIQKNDAYSATFGDGLTGQHVYLFTVQNLTTDAIQAINHKTKMDIPITPGWYLLPLFFRHYGPFDSLKSALDHVCKIQFADEDGQLLNLTGPMSRQEAVQTYMLMTQKRNPSP